MFTMESLWEKKAKERVRQLSQGRLAVQTHQHQYHMAIYIWPYIAIYGHVWPYMGLNGYIWPCMTIDGHVWSYKGAPEWCICHGNPMQPSTGIAKWRKSLRVAVRLLCAIARAGSVAHRVAITGLAIMCVSHCTIFCIVTTFAWCLLFLMIFQYCESKM